MLKCGFTYLNMICMFKKIGTTEGVRQHHCGFKMAFKFSYSHTDNRPQTHHTWRAHLTALRL